MGTPISSRQTAEYTPKRGVQLPHGVFGSRALYPSYASTTQTVAGIEPFSFTITTPSLASGVSSTVTNMQGFAIIQNVKLASFDTGHIVFTNLSVVAPANLAAFHPSLQLVSANGNPINGTLTPATTYAGLAIKATVQVMATSAAAAGTLTISGVALLLGSVSS